MIPLNKVPYSREVRRKGKFVLQMIVTAIKEESKKDKLLRLIKFKFKKPTFRRRVYVALNDTRSEYKLVSEITLASALSFNDACDTVRVIGDEDFQVARVIHNGKQFVTI